MYICVFQQFLYIFSNIKLMMKKNKQFITISKISAAFVFWLIQNANSNTFISPTNPLRNVV